MQIIGNRFSLLALTAMMSSINKVKHQDLFQNVRIEAEYTSLSLLKTAI